MVKVLTITTISCIVITTEVVNTIQIVTEVIVTKKRQALIDARGDQSQKSASEMIGIKQQLLSRYELGLAAPTLKTAFTISAYYGKTIEELFPDLLQVV
jgi:DNA-binding XRE family transcriptional regulator